MNPGDDKPTQPERGTYDWVDSQVETILNKKFTDDQLPPGCSYAPIIHQIASEIRQVVVDFYWDTRSNP